MMALFVSSNYDLCSTSVTALLYANLCLTHKELETHGCVISTVAPDALVLKHQAISIHSAD